MPGKNVAKIKPKTTRPPRKNRISDNVIWENLLAKARQLLAEGKQITGKSLGPPYSLAVSRGLGVADVFLALGLEVPKYVGYGEKSAKVRTERAESNSSPELRNFSQQLFGDNVTTEQLLKIAEKTVQEYRNNVAEGTLTIETAKDFAVKKRLLKLAWFAKTGEGTLSEND